MVHSAIKLGWPTTLAMLIGVSAAILANPIAALAQTRKDIEIQRPGSLRVIGDPAGTYSFRRYSYGIGSLGAGKRGGAGTLGGSISSPADYTVRRPAGGAANVGRVPFGSVARPAPVHIRGGGSTIISRIGTSGVSRIPLGGTRSAAGAAQTYLRAIGAGPIFSTPRPPGPITSLVPQDSGLYAKHMAQAEEAFRAGEYKKALSLYRKANERGRDDPESLLGMAYANYALSKYSFASAGYYLQKAIERFPELPLTPLKPAGFYADQETYEKHLGYLTAHLRKRPSDSNALLILGVFRWFEGDFSAAKAALRKAASASKNPKMLEAIKTFRDGMAASGKVLEPLSPATQPAIVAGSSSPAPPGSPQAPQAPGAEDR